jgi:cobalt/nickel transport system ATP-binding protein
VLAMGPEVLLLDEPSTGLDEATRDRLADVLTSLDIACALISHEADFLERVADRVLLMENGRIRTDAYVHTHAHIHPHAGHPHAEHSSGHEPGEPFEPNERGGADPKRSAGHSGRTPRSGSDDEIP